MSSHATAGLAWGSAALAVAILAAAVVIGSGADTSSVIIAMICLVFSGVGAVIARRQPANAIGWLFLLVGVAAALALLSSGYADRWTAGDGGSRAIGELAATYASLSWIPFVVVPATFIVLLFPDGHLLSRRWRPVAWCAALGIALTFLTGVITSGPLEDYPQIQNPYGVDASFVEPLTGLSFLLLLVGVVGSVASLVVRFRRARGAERLQMKWLAFAGVAAAITLPLSFVASDTVGENVGYAAIMLSVLGLPIAAGLAILRYRLYDIDVVINRTLVYGALTATLAAVYLGSVLVLQLALSGLTAGSGLAVAASTLAVAGIVRPARTRIQELVDRRFYRRRYDAQRTLERFALQLRDEVDLGALDAELREVVAETMQPAHMSLWLRPTPGPP